MGSVSIDEFNELRSRVKARRANPGIIDLHRGDKLPKRKGSPEHQLQVSCVKWFRTQYPQLAMLLLSIPNGAKLSNGAKAWKRLEAEGAVAGAPDLLLLVPSGDYGYLCLEMKTPKGRQSKTQKAYEAAVVAKGGAYCIPRTLDQFQTIVRSYLERGEF